MEIDRDGNVRNSSRMGTMTTVLGIAMRMDLCWGDSHSHYYFHYDEDDHPCPSGRMDQKYRPQILVRIYPTRKRDSLPLNLWKMVSWSFDVTWRMMVMFLWMPNGVLVLVVRYHIDIVYEDRIIIHRLDGCSSIVHDIECVPGHSCNVVVVVDRDDTRKLFVDRPYGFPIWTRVAVLPIRNTDHSLYSLLLYHHRSEYDGCCCCCCCCCCCDSYSYK